MIDKHYLAGFFDGEGTSQTCTISGRDYSAKLMDATIQPIVYTNSEVSTIVKNIIDNNITGITYTNVQTTVATLPRIAFNDTVVFDAIKQLAELVDYVFYIDNNKDLHFEPKGSQISGYTINNTNILSAQFEQSRETMGNVVKVYGDRYLDAYTETITAGSPLGGSVFTLEYKPHNTEVLVNSSIVQPGAILGITNNLESNVKYLVNYEDRQITFVSGTSQGNNIPSSGASVKINYDRALPIIKAGINRGSVNVYGAKTKIINDKSIKDPATAKSILLRELDNASPLRAVEVNLKGWFELTPGQTINTEMADYELGPEDLTVLEIAYNFNKENILKEEVINLKLEKKFPDITDQFTEMKKRLDRLEAQDRQNNDLLSRLELSEGAFNFIGSYWYMRTRNIGNAFILGHPIQGLLGSYANHCLGGSFGPWGIIKSGGYY